MTNSPDTASPITRARRLWWLDALIVFGLIVAALPIRFANAKGDLWFDEAEYAIAGTSGLNLNRWDRSDDPKLPEKTIRLHHYHPPLTAELVGFAARFGTDDRTLRTPFVIAGGIVVGLVYLCGLLLFASAPDEWTRRALAFGCALLTLWTPAQIRQSSHAIPWILITLWLLALTWTLLGYARTRKPGWIVGIGGALGGFWVTSEMALIIAPLVLVLLGWLLWPVLRPPRAAEETSPPDAPIPPVTLPADSVAPPDKAAPPVSETSAVRHSSFRFPPASFALLGSAALFLAIGAIFWPVGLGPHALTMLLHYTGIRDFSIPVTLGGQTYPNAPKWAYYFWYRTRYTPYFAWYALGLVGLAGLVLRRRFDIGATILTLFTGLLLAITHKAHIIGPEYIAHCLPFLTLCGGYAFLIIAQFHRVVGLAMLVLLLGRISFWKEKLPLAGMEPRAQISRWPGAAQWLAEHWKPTDRLAVGPQPPPAPRWYLSLHRQIPSPETHVTQLSYRNTSDLSLQKIAAGFHRFLAISSTVTDRPPIDSRLQTMIAPRLAWQSPEPNNGSPRLLLYEIPPHTLTPPKAQRGSAPIVPPAVMPSPEAPPSNDDATQ